MEQRGFDEITKQFARTPRTRRLAMGLFAASGLGAVLGRVEPKSGVAQTVTCRKLSQTCRRDRHCCSGRCRGTKDKKTCRAHNEGSCKPGPSFCQIGNDAVCGDLCFCFTTTGGAPFRGKQVRGVECQRDAECVTLGFPAGSACAKHNGRVCEIETSTFCVSPCLGPRPL